MSLRLLNIARTSLLSHRAALEIIGQNTANVETPGYVRQRPILSPLPDGGGVEVTDVHRLTDELLLAQKRYQSGWLGQDAATSAALDQVEHIFTDVLDGGMASRIEEMFDAWADLGLSPTSAAAREQVIQRAELAAGSISERWQGLNDLRFEIDQRLGTMVEQANRLAYQIDEANRQLVSVGSPSAANDIMSQRDVLVDELSEMCGAEVIRQENGVVDVVIGGLRIVELGAVSELRLVPDPSQPGMHLIALGGITLGGELRGEMAGRLRARDDLMPDYMVRLDQLAQTLADEVNSLHTAGFDLAGNPGEDFFEYDAAAPGASLKVRDAIQADNSLIAASADATANGDGTNALAIDDLRNSRMLVSGTTTLAEFAGDIVAEVGIDGAAARTRLDGRQTLVDNLREAHASRTGVSLDEEALELVRYQQAYGASAKLLSVAIDLMDQIMQLA